MKQLRVTAEVLAVVATIFVPKVWATRTLEFFNNSYQTVEPLDIWGRVAIAAALLLLLIAILLKYKDRPGLGSTLSIMLMVYSSLCLVGALSSTFGLASLGRLMWCVNGLLGMMTIRYWLRPGEVSWKQLMLQLEAKRFSAIVFLFAWLHVAKNDMFPLVEAVTIGLIIGLPWLANWSQLPLSLAYLPKNPAEIPGAKSFIGTSRWIFAFVAGGCLIFAVTDQASAGWLAAALTCYVLAFLIEWPVAQLLTDELCSVFGSGAATAFHLMFMDRELMERLSSDATNQLHVWVVICLAYVLFAVTGGKLLSLSGRKQEGAG